MPGSGVDGERIMDTLQSSQDSRECEQLHSEREAQQQAADAPLEGDHSVGGF